MHTATTDCEHCDNGTIEFSTDHLDSRGEHFTREHRETCRECNGTGRVEIESEFCTADECLFVGALTEADLERFAAAEAPAFAVAS